MPGTCPLIDEPACRRLGCPCSAGAGGRSSVAWSQSGYDVLLLCLLLLCVDVVCVLCCCAVFVCCISTAPVVAPKHRDAFPEAVPSAPAPSLLELRGGPRHGAGGVAPADPMAEARLGTKSSDLGAADITNRLRDPTG